MCNVSAPSYFAEISRPSDNDRQLPPTSPVGYVNSNRCRWTMDRQEIPLGRVLPVGSRERKQKKERKVLKSSRIIENVLERVDEEGGRYVLNTDILERESWRVVKNDSKEEKSGKEVGNCVKGSRMRKPVPVSPPEEELLPECLRGTLSKV